jgi:hypothetical protein
MSSGPSLQLFVIFHKKIFDDCYIHVKPELLEKYFTFVAVNERIPKEYTEGKYRIIKEWELPIYDPDFQARGYNENSVIRHIYLNGLHKKYDHIGFFQYDQVFNPGCIEAIVGKLQGCESAPPFYHALFPADFKLTMIGTWNELLSCSFMIDDYNRYFNTSHSLESLFHDASYEYPLLNTYIIHKSVFERYMPWIIQLFDKMYPWCVQYPNKTHHGHLGGIWERIMSFAVAMQKIGPIVKMDIQHDHNYKSVCY